MAASEDDYEEAFQKAVNEVIDCLHPSIQYAANKHNLPYEELYRRVQEKRLELYAITAEEERVAAEKARPKYRVIKVGRAKESDPEKENLETPKDSRKSENMVTARNDPESNLSVTK